MGTKLLQLRLRLHEAKAFNAKELASASWFQKVIKVKAHEGQGQRLNKDPRARQVRSQQRQVASLEIFVKNVSLLSKIVQSLPDRTNVYSVLTFLQIQLFTK